MSIAVLSKISKISAGWFAKGKKNGRMFTLNVNMSKAGMAMYAQGARFIANVDMWHKRIGHVNPQR